MAEIFREGERSQFARRFKLSLRTALITPLFLQVIAAIIIFGGFTYYYTQGTLRNLANELMVESTEHVVQHLDNHLGMAHEINRSNADALKSGIFRNSDFQSLGNYFYRQLHQFDFLYIRFKRPDGSAINVGQGSESKLEMSGISPASPAQLSAHAIDYKSDRVALNSRQSVKGLEATWYQDAVAAGRPLWSPIYVRKNPYAQIGMSASFPAYGENQELLGVFGIDLDLTHLSRSLKNQKNQYTSRRLFILERSGTLVASSDESPGLLVQDQATRVRALNSQDPIIREVTQRLIDLSGGLDGVISPQSFSMVLDQKVFVRVVPYQDAYGLDWLLVMAIPETELLPQLQKTWGTAVLVFGVFLAIIAGLAATTSEVIAHPIDSLTRATKAMVRGNLKHPIRVEGIIELEDLAQNLDNMRAQLNYSINTLETRVKERTELLAMNVEKLEKLVNLDGLTQIPNRRCFDNHLETEWHRHRRVGQSLALLLIDIDFFKYYNETEGHQVGDECLRQVARAIAAIPKRATDLTARYGGEEFAIILTHSDTEGALKVASLVQAAIANLAIPHQASLIADCITLSIGVASKVPSLNTSAYDLIAEADDALYVAKQQGRNRVVPYEVVVNVG